MFRSALITATLALGLASFVQAQVVNYGGYATTAPTANVTQNPSVVNAQGAPSVPAINTPVAHVGPQAGIANQPGEQATAPNATTPAQPETAQGQNSQANSQAMDLGVSTVATNPFLTPGSGDNGQPLGDVAREMKQREQSLNARTYTNADIDRINQSTGVNNGAATTNASNYPANNGVITPPANNQNSIAAPVQNQSTTNAIPATNENNTPTNIPQANAKPSPDRPYEMASNNSANAGIPQAGNDQNTNAQNTDAQNAGAANQANDNAQASDNSKQLPKTASRLPLIGVLGFFSISMGLFVRYQREKASK